MHSDIFIDIFISHLFIFQHGFKVPNPLPKPQWPNHVKEDLKQAIIANRKYIIQDLKDVFSSKLDHNKFLKNRATDDISFEDPLERKPFATFNRVPSIY